MRTPLYPRFARPLLLQALSDTPAVLIHGPRQSGKTTLALEVAQSSGYEYFSFDDDTIVAAVRQDSAGFVAGLPEKVVLDEVQRVPELFSALKLAIDRNRKPGRFILTGSANVLLVPKLSDSLAGRMEILRLYPLAQCEIARTRSVFLDVLFSGEFKLKRYDYLGKELMERVAAGGYPAAIARPSERRRQDWYRNYIETLIQRDVRDLARISALDALPTLLELASGQTARLLNISELASPFQLSRPTISEYVSLLERIFLLDFLLPWHSNRISRLIKTPKLHMGDTGLATALLGVNAAALAQDRPLFGQLLETFIYGELKRQASWHIELVSFHHFRDKDGYEVDIVLEAGNKIAGVEVKAAATVGEKDFRGLKKLQDTVGNRFVAGIVFYDGETALRFGAGLFAIPVRMLWEA